jgi:hypothetical protein
MNRRRTPQLVIIAWGLAGGLVFLFWPKQSGQPLVRLRIVRRTVEQGRSVAYFKIEVADSRVTRIVGVQRVSGDHVDDPFSSGSLEPTKCFWAASEVGPMGPMANPSRARKEFGVIAPQGALIWKVRVEIESAAPSNQFERFKAIPRVWRMFRGAHYSFSRALRATWGVFVNDPLYMNHLAPMLQITESDLITNAVAPAVSSNAIQ